MSMCGESQIKTNGEPIACEKTAHSHCLSNIKVYCLTNKCTICLEVVNIVSDNYELEMFYFVKYSQDCVA